MLPLNSESETIRRTTAEYLCAMADLSCACLWIVCFVVVVVVVVVTDLCVSLTAENLEAVCKEYAASVGTFAVSRLFI